MHSFGRLVSVNSNQLCQQILTSVCVFSCMALCKYMLYIALSLDAALQMQASLGGCAAAHAHTHITPSSTSGATDAGYDSACACIPRVRVCSSLYIDYGKRPTNQLTQHKRDKPCCTSATALRWHCWGGAFADELSVSCCAHTHNALHWTLKRVQRVCAFVCVCPCYAHV